MRVQLSLSLHFYLLLIAAMKMTRNNVFSSVDGRLLVALKRAGCVVCWFRKVPFLVWQMFKVMSFRLRDCT